MLLAQEKLAHARRAEAFGIGRTESHILDRRPLTRDFKDRFGIGYKTDVGPSGGSFDAEYFSHRCTFHDRKHHFTIELVNLKAACGHVTGCEGDSADGSTTIRFGSCVFATILIANCPGNLNTGKFKASATSHIYLQQVQ